MFQGEGRSKILISRLGRGQVTQTSDGKYFYGLYLGQQTIPYSVIKSQMWVMYVVIWQGDAESLTASLNQLNAQKLLQREPKGK